MIPGLTYQTGILTADDQAVILAEIDSRPWITDLKRRTQHYGYRYDYTAKRIDPSMFVGPLPQFSLDVASLLIQYGLIESVPDQLIINEYMPGQGIAAHVDCVPCFKDVIATVSLGSVYEMDFIKITSDPPDGRLVHRLGAFAPHALAGGRVVSMPLELGSALVLRGEARYNWMHRIRSRSKDPWGKRERRVSLTFRTVIL